MIHKKILTTILLTTLSAYSLTAKPAYSKISDGAGIKQPLSIETFVDRKIINKGEEINLKIWVNSQQIKAANITIFYADKYLNPVGVQPIQTGIIEKKNINLSKTSPQNFTFTGVTAGKYNLNIEVSTTDKKIPPKRLQINELEVKDTESLLWKLLSNSLLGVVIGALIPFGFTYFLSSQRQRQKKIIRQQLILSNLLAHLENNHLAITDQEEPQKIDFKSWINMLLTQGYYLEIKELIEKKGGQVNLANDLLDIGFKLRKCEELRFRERLTENQKNELSEKLSEAIEKLKQLTC